MRDAWTKNLHIEMSGVISTMITVSGIWTKRADEAQRALERHFWNDSIRMYNIETPCPNGACNTIFHYWWMAHAADVLVDGYVRTADPLYAERLEQLYEGVLRRNDGEWPNELYDDMEWMALAWLRAYEATGLEKYKQAALTLWEDIQTGWNDIQGGELLGTRSSSVIRIPRLMRLRLFWRHGCIGLSATRRTWNGLGKSTLGRRMPSWILPRVLSGTG